MKDNRKPVPHAGYYASDGTFLFQLYAVAFLRSLTPMERQAVLNSLKAMK